ncbi:hypothetical protein CDN99_03545 [Roseateles aquatilis]|uniref:Uncharacterized protein n=2 Tax=Roseateles aquatilis TaxID=431061 RepID=A0A246JLN2_9BURK|nr:hypothetical protein CDN99_03545 [Roseateles aquatilis]
MSAPARVHQPVQSIGRAQSDQTPASHGAEALPSETAQAGRARAPMPRQEADVPVKTRIAPRDDRSDDDVENEPSPASTGGPSEGAQSLAPASTPDLDSPAPTPSDTLDRADALADCVSHPSDLNSSVDAPPAVALPCLAHAEEKSDDHVFAWMGGLLAIGGASVGGHDASVAPSPPTSNGPGTPTPGQPEVLPPPQEPEQPRQPEGPEGEQQPHPDESDPIEEPPLPEIQVPGRPTLSLANDSGVSRNDGITADPTVRVDGLIEHATWFYSLDNGATWRQGTGDTIPAAAFAADGLQHVLVRQTGPSGHSSTTSVLHFDLDRHIDALAPTLAQDTGLHADDRVTRHAAVRVDGIEDGARWEYRLAGHDDWHEGHGDKIPQNVFREDGAHAVEVRQIDLAGNVSIPTSLNFTLDTHVATPTLQLHVDSGRPGDLVTNNAAVDVGGLEAGGTWEYLWISASGDSGWVQGSGAQLPDSLATADGDVTVLARQTDLAGNTSGVASLTFTRDTSGGDTAPLSVTLKHDTGRLGDLISQDITLVVDGLEAQAHWEYQLDGRGDWVHGTGQEIPDDAFIGDGAHTVLVRQVSLAGTASPATRVHVVRDTQALAPQASLVNDTGHAADDRITNDASVHLAGLEAQAEWFYSIDAGASWIQGDGDTIAGNVFGDGPVNLLVHQVDVAGNRSADAALNFTLDSQTFTPTLTLAEDTGDDSDDGLTRNGNVLVGGLEPGARWQFSIDDGDWIDGVGTEIPHEAFPNDGPHRVEARQIDAAGNRSDVTALMFELDTVVITPRLSLLNDTGVSATDGITRDSTIQVDGLEPGAHWRCSVDGGVTWTEGTEAIIQGLPFTVGPAHIQLVQIDAAGNVSDPAELSFTRVSDLAAPSLSLRADTGHDGTDAITRDGTLIVGGLVDGATWQYRLAPDAAWLDGSGTMLPSEAFATDGRQTVQVRQIDIAGHVSEITAFDFTLDRTPPTIDLTDTVGIQSSRQVVLDAAECRAGVPLTALTGELADDDLHELRLVLGGDAFDATNDRLVLDREIALDSDAVGDGVRLGSVDDLRYRYDSATRSLSIGKTDGTPLTGAEATGLTNEILWRNGASGLREGARTITLSGTDIAGNVSASATITVTVDTRVPSLDLNGSQPGTDANWATASLTAGVAPFAADLTLTHGNPDATLRRVEVTLSGSGASRIDQLASVATDGSMAAWAGNAAVMTVAGVDWAMTRLSNTYTFTRADGAQSSPSEARALLDSLRLSNEAAAPLQGSRTYTVTVFDHLGRSDRARGTIVYDTEGPTIDLNGALPGTDRGVTVTPGLAWDFGLARPAAGVVLDTDAITRMTLRFASNVVGAFDGNDATRAEWVGFFNDTDAADHSRMLRLGTTGELTVLTFLPRKTLTLSLAADGVSLSIATDSPLTPDEASQVLRALSFQSADATVPGIRTVEFSAVDRAGNTTTLPATARLDVRNDVPVMRLDPSADTGLHDRDSVTRLNGGVDAPLLFSGLAAAGQTVTVFRDDNNNGQLDAAERLGTTVADANGRWSLSYAGAPLADGSYRIAATCNGRVSDAVDLTVDTRPPASTFSMGQSVHVVPVLAGTTDPGATVRVELDADNNLSNGYEVAYGVIADETGRWVLDTATASPIAGQAVTYASGAIVQARVIADDLAGNETVRTASSVAQSSIYSISDSHVIEGTSGTREMVFMVTREGDLTEAGSVHYAVDAANSSARANASGAAADNDYSGAAAGRLDFAPGESSKLVRFAVNGDYFREVNDKLVVKLHDATQGAIGDETGIGNINEIDISRLQAAYGLRDLNPQSNDFAIRVRRSSDNAEQDIGFDVNGNLDQQALLDFVGRTSTSKGFVTTWYDQSGHGVDMLQPDMAKQGVIVDAGKAVTRSDGLISISFNNGRNGRNDDCMVANGVAATDWKSFAAYAKVQVEGMANGSLFNLGEAGAGRLSACYPDYGSYCFDVRNQGATERLKQPVPAGTTLLGKATDVVFEAHSGNTGAGTPAMNYTDAKQLIFDDGVRVASDDSLPSQFPTSKEWKLAWHGAYGSSDSNYYQQAMYNEFLVFLDKDGKATPSMQSLIGTAGSDVLTYSGEMGLTSINGLAGEDTLYLSGSVDLDFAAMSGGVRGIEQVWMDNGAVNTLTLSATTLAVNGASTLTITMDAGDAVILDGTRMAHSADQQTLILGSAGNDRLMGTARNDVMIGGAGLDTFTWLQNQGGHDTVLDYTAAQGDQLDLTALLRGFTAGSETRYIHKAVDSHGDVVLAIDWDGNGHFDQPDLTITLVHVNAADAITLVTAAGTSVL